MSANTYSQDENEPENVANPDDEHYWTDMAEFLAGQQGNDN